MASRDASAFMGKAALCKLLGWSRPKLDRCLERDPHFPVHKKGTRSGGWIFSLADVQRYLSGQDQVDISPVPIIPVVPPNDDADADNGRSNPFEHDGEKTARQRRELAQAALLEAKLLTAQGALVKADDMRETLGFMLHHLAKGLDGLPDKLVKKLNLPPDAVLVIRDQIDDMRRTMANDLRTLLTEES